MTKFLLIMTTLLFVSVTTFAQDEQPWKLFKLEKLSQENSNTDGSYLRFLNESSLSMGLYELKAGTKDEQNPHQLDEVYYMVKGKALLVVGEDTVEASSGTIAYVKANIPHKFAEISEDIQVLVIFSKTEPSANNPDHLIFTINDLRKQRKSGENTWNQFLDVSSMRMGLYMLPRSVGGDEILTHEVDEINIVVDGKSTFVVGNEEFEVKPGSVFYVEQGRGHRFKNLQDENLDVLILFHRK